MAPREPFIPAKARHDRVEGQRSAVNKAVRDLLAHGIDAEEAAKRDGKQGALDGIPNLALGSEIGAVLDDGTGGGPPKKDTTEKSTGKEEGKEGKEGKEAKDTGEKGKDSSEVVKPAGETVEFGFVRYGLPEAIETQRLEAAVSAHAARDLAKGPIV